VRAHHDFNAAAIEIGGELDRAPEQNTAVQFQPNAGGLISLYA
jgi:hypothetical protein